MWIEKLSIGTRQTRSLGEGAGLAADLARRIEELRSEEGDITELAGDVAGMWEKVGGELKGDDLDLGDPAALVGLLDEVEALLLSRLQGGGA